MTIIAACLAIGLFMARVAYLKSFWFTKQKPWEFAAAGIVWALILAVPMLIIKYILGS